MRKTTIMLLMLAVSLGVSAEETNPYKKFQEGLPFKMDEVRAPQIPDRTVSLDRFGADNTGQKICTAAFNQAMEDLTSRGGGHLVVPRGVWLTGPIVLRSNIDLHLEKGAIIQFVADEALYPLVTTSFEGLDTRRCQSPISGINLENVSITGEGVIDGNGQYWRPLKKGKVNDGMWKKLTSQPGGVMKRPDYWVPSESYNQGEQLSSMNVPDKPLSLEEWKSIKRFLRPVMISLVGCKNVLLQGVIFQNSPAWNIHPLMCENIIIDQVLARNPAYAQNGDALDLESCKNALIVNSRFDAGDDGICIKSGKDKDGRQRGRPCENVVVDGCTVFAGHGGFVVGSEMSGGVRNISVKGCQFVGTDVGLRFKSTRGRGGVVENIFIDGVSMTDIATYALTFNMYYGGKSVAEVLADSTAQQKPDTVPVTEETPIFRNIDIRNVICHNAGYAMEFNGLPEMPIDSIFLKDIFIFSKEDAIFENCKNITKENVQILLERDLEKKESNKKPRRR
ncbi:MAG: glycoside hydrolase family 28 protein [Prevotella sp.]|nr:glycoside hydrolase family 28 protein [Prevotella sp.]